jgi:hypothetical protein
MKKAIKTQVIKVKFIVQSSLKEAIMKKAINTQKMLNLLSC